MGKIMAELYFQELQTGEKSIAAKTVSIKPELILRKSTQPASLIRK
jgi:DNA-binding LacI/PurR family transcriptional regulator